MKTVRVEIKFPSGKTEVYTVLDVYEHIDNEGVVYLAMKSLKNYEYGFIPMGVIESYKILKEA